MAVSGDKVLVGAYYENNNSSFGAAYVFTGLGFGPRLALLPDGSGGHFIRFTGAPEVTYTLQRAPSVTGPWETIAELTAPVSGLLEFHDTTPLPGQAFYRTVQP